MSRNIVKFCFGCMSSGKSLHLLATAHNFQEHSIPFLILKSSLDTRDGENVIHSRALGDRECITVYPDDSIFELISSYYKDKYEGEELLKWILVDECQFLTEKQVEEVCAVADKFNISVICYGLRTNFQGRLFSGSKRLFELADEIEEIKSSCFCNGKTVINARLNANKEIVVDGEEVEIGGDDKYVSLCRKCFFEKTGHPLYKIYI